MGDENESIRNIGEDDQLAASIKTTAQMTAEMFDLLRKEGMTRTEAFVMTQTWLEAVLRRRED